MQCMIAGLFQDGKRLFSKKDYSPSFLSCRIQQGRRDGCLLEVSSDPVPLTFVPVAAESDWLSKLLKTPGVRLKKTLEFRRNQIRDQNPQKCFRGCI